MPFLGSFLVVSSDPNSKIHITSEILSGENEKFLFSSELSQSLFNRLTSNELKVILISLTNNYQL